MSEFSGMQRRPAQGQRVGTATAVHRPPRGRPIGVLAALLSLAVAIPVAWQMDRRHTERLLLEKRAELETDLLARVHALETGLDRRIALLEGLAAFLVVHPGGEPLERQFVPFASALHRSAPGIRSVQALPGGVARFVYPLAGNEAILNYDLMADDRPWIRPALDLAVATGEAVLSGPFELRQGGTGVAARIAVFTGDDLWGFAAIISDVSAILAEAGLDRDDDDLDILVRDGEERAFFGAEAIAGTSPVTRRVRYAGMTWELLAVPPGGWEAPIAQGRRVFRYSATLVVALLAAISYLVAGRQSRLASTVAARTSDLEAANRELAAASGQFRRAVACSPRPVIIYAEDGEILQLSRTWTELTGYREEELRTVQDWGRLACGERAGAILAGVDRLFSLDGPVHEGEFEVRTSSGEIRTWDFSTAALGRHADGRRLLVSAAVDVTERRRAEAALRDSEARYRSLFESIRDAIFLTEPNGRVTAANPAACRMFGMTEERLCQAGRNGLVDLADPRLADLLAEREQTGAAQGELAMFRADGSRFPAEIASVVMEDGRRAFVSVRDITERKQAEEALRRYEILARHTRDIILFIRNGDGAIVQANAAAVAAYGWSMQELCRLNIRDLRAPEALDSLAAHLAQADAGGLDFATDHRRRDGSTFPVEVRSQGITIGADRIIMSVIRDISERRAMEDLAREHQAQLAHLSRVASVGEMASGLAHELNQPLGAILNYATLCADLIERGETRPEAMDRALHALAAEAHRAGEIVRRLRAFIRRQPPLRQPADIGAVVREALGLMSHELRRAEIQPALDIAAGLPPASIDVVQIQQVIVNLLQNALDAMADVPPRERRLAIRVSLDGPAIEVAVRDNGCGIAPEQSSSIFKAFVTTKANGLGLGLAISRSIIEAHAGELLARPNPTAGMTFAFRLSAP